MALPAPSCKLGYTAEDLLNVLGTRLNEFYMWMGGQTFSSCDGRRYNHETEEYEPTYCGPHGFVYYPWDVQGFLDDKPITD